MEDTPKPRFFNIPLLNFGSLKSPAIAEKISPPQTEKAALVPDALDVPETHFAGPDTVASTVASGVTGHDSDYGGLQDCEEQAFGSDPGSRVSSPGNGNHEAQHEPLSGATSLAAFPLPRVRKPKSYGAGPRSFLKSTLKRSHLETGDVISISQEGQLYKVVPAGIDEETGKKRFHLELSTDGITSDDPSTHLEVCRQGDFFGFRSALAEDRFLQARRRGGQLSFFNTNLGVWEQWELVTGQPVSEWNEARLGFRSRQLPQMIVHMEIQRIGSFIVAPNAFLTPRSFDVPVVPGDGVDDAELNRISQWAIQEHKNFVQKEKKAMTAIDRKLARLLREKEELKEWAAAQVSELWHMVDSNHAELEERLLVTEDELAMAWVERRKFMKWMIQAATRKHQIILSQRAFLEWRTAVTHKLSQRAAVKRQLERNKTRLMATHFSVWREHAQAGLLVKRRMRSMIDRSAERISITVFRAWADHAATQRELQAVQQDAANKGYARVEMQRAKAAFLAWQQVVEQRRLLGHVADRMAESRSHAVLALGFDAWRCHTKDAQAEAAAVSKAVKFYAKSTMAAVLSAWRDMVAEARYKEEAALALMAHRQSLLAAKVFQHWALMTAGRIQNQQVIKRALARTEARTLSAVFRGWRVATEESQARHQAANQLVGRLATAHTRAFFMAWQQHTRMACRVRDIVAERRALLQQRLTAAAFENWRCHTAQAQHLRSVLTIYVNKHSANTAQSAFTAWSAVVAEKQHQRQAIAKFVARRRQAVLARCMAAFGEARELAAEAERESERRAALYNKQLLAVAISGWIDLQQRQQDRAAAAEDMARRVSSRKEAEVLHAWQLAALQKHELARVGTTIVARHKRSVLQTAFSEWMCEAAMIKQDRLDKEAEQRAAEQEARHQELKVSRMRAICQQRLLRRLFSEWAMFAAERQEDRSQACAVLVRFKRTAETRIKANFFLAWARLLDQNDDIVDLIRYRSTQILVSATFHNWRSTTLEHQQARAELTRAITKATSIRPAEVFSAWRAFALEQKCLRITGQHVASSSKLALLRQAFLGWRVTTVDHMEAVGRLNAVAVGVKLSWAASSREGLLQHVSQLSCGSQDKALQVTVLAAWISYTQERKEKHQLVSNVLAKRRLRVLRTSLQAWHERTGIRQVQGMKVARSLDRLRISRMRTAFSEWVEVLAEDRAIHDRLRTCIAAKRISHRLFVKWYLESLDEKVQATMQQLYDADEDDVQLPMMTPQPSMPLLTRGRQDDSDDRIAAHFSSQSSRNSPSMESVSQLKTLLRSSGAMGGLSTCVAPVSGPLTQGRELVSQTLRGSFSARGPRPDPLGATLEGPRPLSGSMTARGGIYSRRSLEVPERGALTARASTAQRELDEDIANLMPRVSSSFANLCSRDFALPSVARAALIPLPEEDEDLLSDEEHDVSETETSPADSGGARSVASPPGTFSPLGEGLLVHRLEYTPGGTQIQSHPTNVDEDSTSETSEFRTAWGGPQTPYLDDIDQMTPSYWAGAPGTALRTSPLPQGRPTYSAVTPPVFHSGFLQKVVKASQEPVRTPGPGKGDVHFEEPAP